MVLYNNERLTHITRYIETFEKDESEAKKLKIYIDRLNEMLKKFYTFVSEEKNWQLFK